MKHTVGFSIIDMRYVHTVIPCSTINKHANSFAKFYQNNDRTFGEYLDDESISGSHGHLSEAFRRLGKANLRKIDTRF